MTRTTPVTAATQSSLIVDQVPIDALRPDPANPRRISDDELEALTRSLHRFGFVQPVLARREDGVVIGGHQRLVAARRLGITVVPVSGSTSAPKRPACWTWRSTRSPAPGTSSCWPGYWPT